VSLFEPPAVMMPAVRMRGSSASEYSKRWIFLFSM